MLTRRQLLKTSALATAPLLLPRLLGADTPVTFVALPQAFQHLEQQNHCRLGVAVMDTATGKQVGYRAGERFTMCSTFKWLLAAMVVQRAHAGQMKLDERLHIPPKPLLGVSPLTEPHAGGDMTVEALCQAIVTRSDNTAANVLLDRVGGPPAWTAFARSLGDNISRLDHNEPKLNESHPGDDSDTTTPEASVRLLHNLIADPAAAAVYGPVKQWMIDCQTGLERLRAHLPSGWTAADKTGSDGETISNDIAVLWPPHAKPLVVAAYVHNCPGDESKRSGILAEVGRLVSTARRPIR